MFELQKKIKIQWTPNFAYAIGLITSDGFLHKDGRHLGFVSKEIEMIRNFRAALNIRNKVSKGARGGEKEKNYFYQYFGDKNFYLFLNKIGLTKAKSKTIKSVTVPKKYFCDFLRGLYDGDGSFYTFWDKRWPNSFGYKLSFTSASFIFIDWLRKRILELYGAKGYFHQGKGVFEIRYVKGDSVKLFNIMHACYPNHLFLKRKYDKIKNAIVFDKKNKK